jgi:Domain of unknown function (DUF4410)
VAKKWNHIRSRNGLTIGAAATLLLLTASSRWATVARADGPLAAKVKVTTLQSYSGSPLGKPNKILIYDLVVDTDVQVDTSQEIRPRHMIAGDENPEAIAKKSQSTFSDELAKRLAKTGIPVEHVNAGIAPSDDSLVIQGTFASLRQGDKTERSTVGMGLGSAEVQTKIDVRLKTPSEAVLLSQFRTETTAAKNVGGAAPAAAGMNPAAVATKSVVTDRKKTLNSYVTKTADASAKEITKLMADQGWIKLDDKGEVVEK